MSRKKAWTMRNSNVTGGDLLSAIVAATKQGVRERQTRQPIGPVRAAAVAKRSSGVSFKAALCRPGRFNVIAECKKRSPSAGLIRSNYNASKLAVSYANAGAAAISVLTEPGFFDGTLSDLSDAREAIEIPVLRKDFIVSEYQIYESVLAGANAILLIVAALSREELERLSARARAVGLAILTEIHDEVELAAALAVDADVVGINNRNLKTLDVDLDASMRLIKQIPERVIAVAESGLTAMSDLANLRRLGFDAYLIGESLLKETNPGRALEMLLLGGDARKPRGKRSPSNYSE